MKSMPKPVKYCPTKKTIKEIQQEHPLLLNDFGAGMRCYNEVVLFTKTVTSEDPASGLVPDSGIMYRRTHETYKIYDYNNNSY